MANLIKKQAKQNFYRYLFFTFVIIMSYYDLPKHYFFLMWQKGLPYIKEEKIDFFFKLF